MAASRLFILVCTTLCNMSASVTITELVFDQKRMPSNLDANGAVDVQAMFETKNWKAIPSDHLMGGECSHNHDYSEYTIEAWNRTASREMQSYYYGKLEKEVYTHILEQQSLDGTIVQYTLYDGKVLPITTLSRFSKSHPPVWRNGLCVIPSPWHTLVSRIKNSDIVTFFAGLFQ